MPSHINSSDIHFIFRMRVSTSEKIYINPGEAVNVEDEVVVVNSVVLPNKTLNVSVQEEIIL